MCQFNKEYNQFTICDSDLDNYRAAVNKKKKMYIEVKNGKISRKVRLNIGELTNVELSQNSLEYQSTSILELEKNSRKLANDVIEYIVIFRDSAQQIVSSKGLTVSYKDGFNSGDTDLYQHKLNDGVVLL